MPRLICYPGQSNRNSFFHNGYSYHCEWYRNNRVFRCSRRKKFHCPGKIEILDEDMNIDESKTIAHYNHEPDLLLLQKLAFKRELFRRCQETNEPLVSIWNNMALEFPDIAVHLRYKGLTSSMYFYRGLNVPKMPENLHELAERVGEFAKIRDMYVGHCEDTNGGIALMFLHPDMRDPLKECTALFGDGTFKIRPKNPRDIAQVYTFHLMKNLSGFPAFFFLTNARTADLYKAMLRQMIREIPELAHLQSISTDFERSIITAVREVLPNARLSGCLFHYKQALRRYWYWKCHIPDEFHNILEYAMSLAYLPAESMEAGFNVVMGLMSYHNVPNADRFNTYFRRQWLPLANVVSVYGRRIRTNNVCENFHLHAKTFIGIRQGLWLMLERLGKLAKLFTIRYKTAVETGLLHWSWPAELLRANRDLDAMEPTLPEIGVRNYLEFVVRQRRGRFLPEIEKDNADGDQNFEVDDSLVDELHRIGLNVFITQDEIGDEFEVGVPADQRIRLAPVQVRLQDLPDDTEHNSIVSSRRGRGRGRGSARGGRGGARGGTGGNSRGSRGRGVARGRARRAIQPAAAVDPASELLQPLAAIEEPPAPEDPASNLFQPLAAIDQPAAAVDPAPELLQPLAAIEEPPAPEVPASNLFQPLAAIDQPAAAVDPASELLQPLAEIDEPPAPEDPASNLFQPLAAIDTAEGNLAAAEARPEEDSSSDEINSNDNSLINGTSIDNEININQNFASENNNDQNNGNISENNPGGPDERTVPNEIRNARAAYYERRFGNNSQRGELLTHSPEEPSVTDDPEADNESPAANNSTVPKKKRRRNPRSKCQLLGCENKLQVRKLDCGHRFCVPCIKNFMTRHCPQCRRAIGNYLPPHLMGGEKWESDEARNLDNNFYRQVNGERLDLEQRAYDLDVNVDEFYNGGEIEL